jgi:hypothetical protein
MIKLHQLYEAISEMEKLRISGEEMIILSPPDVVRRLAFEEMLDVAMIWEDCPGRRHRFHGILVVEDPEIREVVVRSLITDHRVVVKGE